MGGGGGGINKKWKHYCGHSPENFQKKPVIRAMSGKIRHFLLRIGCRGKNIIEMSEAVFEGCHKWGSFRVGISSVNLYYCSPLITVKMKNVFAVDQPHVLLCCCNHHEPKLVIIGWYFQYYSPFFSIGRGTSIPSLQMILKSRRCDL